MTFTYSSWADVRSLFGGDNYCENGTESYAAFLKNMMIKIPSLSSSNGEFGPISCTVVAHFKNKDSGIAHAADGSASVSNCGQIQDCNANYNEVRDQQGNISADQGSPWNNWTAEYKDHYYQQTELDTLNGTTTEGYGGMWAINFPPSNLAFDGFVCDQIFFRARMIYDYVRNNIPIMNPNGAGFNPAYVEGMNAAQLIARYALRIIAEWGYHLVHEVGHTYLGNMHCKWGCCFELAAQQWLCKVRGHLGLPEGEYVKNNQDSDWPLGLEDFPTQELNQEVSNCGDEGIPVEPVMMTCSIRNVFNEDSLTKFCATIATCDAENYNCECSGTGAMICVS
jgi:hypothetical protein